MSPHLPDLASVGLFAAIVCLLSLGFVWWEVRRAPRVDEWQQLQQKVDSIRADLDRMPLLDRIAHDEMAKFIEAWEAAE